MGAPGGLGADPHSAMGAGNPMAQLADIMTPPPDSMANDYNN